MTPNDNSRTNLPNDADKTTNLPNDASKTVNLPNNADEAVNPQNNVDKTVNVAGNDADKSSLPVFIRCAAILSLFVAVAVIPLIFSFFNAGYIAPVFVLICLIAVDGIIFAPAVSSCLSSHHIVASRPAPWLIFFSDILLFVALLFIPLLAFVPIVILVVIAAIFLIIFSVKTWSGIFRCSKIGKTTTPPTQPAVSPATPLTTPAVLPQQAAVPTVAVQPTAPTVLPQQAAAAQLAAPTVATAIDTSSADDTKYYNLLFGIAIAFVLILLPFMFYAIPRSGGLNSDMNESINAMFVEVFCLGGLYLMLPAVGYLLPFLNQYLRLLVVGVSQLIFPVVLLPLVFSLPAGGWPTVATILIISLAVNIKAMSIAKQHK